MPIQYKSLLISLFVVASFIYASLSLAAQTNISSTLLLNLGAIYDSNFYYNPVDERGVTTYLVQPGIDLGYETGKSEIAFHYTLDANYYDESNEDDFYGQTANFAGDFTLSDRFSFNLTDNFIKTRDSSYLDELLFKLVQLDHVAVLPVGKALRSV